MRFARELREEGVLASPDQVAAFAEALGTVPLERELFRAAARATLVCRRDDLAAFERVFARFWHPEAPAVPLQGPAAERQREGGIAPLSRGKDGDLSPLAERTLSYSPGEVLRRKRFENCSEEELAALKRLILRLAWRPPERRTRRLGAWQRGPRLDWGRTLRRAMRQGGEVTVLHWRRLRVKPRPLVVFLDISGSMAPYARMLLVFLYALLRTRPLEAFVFGTRLTRVTAALSAPSADAALAAIGREASDWSGGTRIGESLQSFRRHWAGRFLRRGAGVLLMSDGWDRGEPSRLEEEMAKLQRRAHRLVWLNPLLDTPGYAPRTRGLQAALPFVDDFLPVANLQSLENLALHLERLPARRPLRRSGRARNARPRPPSAP